MPLLNGPDGRKLSKRHGAITVEDFRAQGYIPEAFVNFMALLGWSYDDHTEIMSRDELVERFTLERVGKSAATFDYEKLTYMNGVYLRALAPEEYSARLVAYLREQGYDWDEELIRRSAPLVQEKIATLGEFPKFAGFLFGPVGSTRRWSPTVPCSRPQRRRSPRWSRSIRTGSRPLSARWPSSWS